MLYAEGHPNYSSTLEALIADLKATSIKSIREFHQSHYGTESMLLIFAGDIDFEQITASVANAFHGWESGVSYPENQYAQLPNVDQEDRIYIADKTSVSVHYGYNTGLRRTHEDYIPFMLGNYILGGSFHSRLMAEVRKNQGLTYDIRSFHRGDIFTPGNWTLTASFSPALLDEGLEATESVLRNWHAEGVTPEEVAAAIETLSGSYLVGLSTTDRVASQLHSFVQRGFPPKYIDQYPLRLRDITAEQVNDAIQEYLDPAATSLVVAGSLDQPAPPKLTMTQNRTIALRIDTPDMGWGLEIDRILKTDEKLIVISTLSHSGEISAQAITTVAASATIPADIELPVEHYVLGKTWNWGDLGDYNFIESLDSIATTLDDAELIYSK
jgi:zinc protease